ncbi:TIP41 family protein [Pleurotus pulmonarius]
MTEAVAVPEHKLGESPNTRSIEIYDWFIEVSTNPISNSAELDALQGSLGIPLPEMTFGSNYLRLEHRPSRWVYRFDAENALKGVRKGELQDGDGGVKVGYADAWLKSRTDPSSQSQMPTTVTTKPYDWTYTTTYPGHPSNANSNGWKIDESLQIPMAELTRPDPILFFAEVPLFEDELHDNGTASYTIKIRVMPTCIFLLARFTLHVDNVLFRMHDTRMYHSFASKPPQFIREVSGWEAPYDMVKRKLPRRDDLTPLTDPQFIGKVLTEMNPQISQREGAKTGWRGLGTTRALMVLHSIAETTEAMAGLSVAASE